MLVLSRKTGERIRIRTKDGTEIWIHVIELTKWKMRIGLEAGNGVEFMREELLPTGEGYVYHAKTNGEGSGR